MVVREYVVFASGKHMIPQIYRIYDDVKNLPEWRETLVKEPDDFHHLL
jgi:hypothetical protein